MGKYKAYLVVRRKERNILRTLFKFMTNAIWAAHMLFAYPESLRQSTWKGLVSRQAGFRYPETLGLPQCTHNGSLFLVRYF
ncbi:hypothetical protein EMGBS15_08200 [Filimonas sp.]|jgi:hypothetical protein|nr:hypothetical protein EMGBS15_08200 [Filimonas sp.]